jgi:hypothetical protein
MDNFHTGFNLCALRSIAVAAETTEFDGHLRKGFDFFRQHFIRDNDVVQYYHDRLYPIDTHCIAQSVITLIELKGLAEDNVILAERVMQWGLDHMWDDAGFFYYRKLRTCTIKTSYMRWTQAWMLVAMTTLLRELESTILDQQPLTVFASQS